MLSDEAVKEFQELYKKEYGKELSKEEAREMGQRLVGMVKAVYGPTPSGLLKKPISKNK